MIGSLHGILLEKTPPLVLIDCNGVGYECEVPMSTFYNLPAIGEKVIMLTHFVVREGSKQFNGLGKI